MAYADLLIHTCEVRARSGQLDRFGQPQEPSPSAPPVHIYPCRLTSVRGGERFQERARDIVGETWSLFLPVDAELYESDRVTVKDQHGGVIVDLANVTFVSRPVDSQDYHHVEAKIEQERSSTDAVPR